MIIKIDGKKHNVSPLSKLSTNDFIQVVNKMRYLDLVSYLSAMTGKNIEKSKVKINNLELAESVFLDEDIDIEKLRCPESLQFDGNVLSVKELDNGTFGRRYLFNVYRRNYEEKKFGIHELMVYAVAINLSKKEEYEDIDDIYKKLMSMRWTVVLPIGFFLCQKLVSRRSFSMISFRRSMLKLLYSARRRNLRRTATT